MELGVCYYPEQWPRPRWAVDAELMAQAGLRHVRIGEFAWAAYEPERNRFDWEWLDSAIDTLANAGLEVTLGTPTATPPIWLAMERPEILSVGPDGSRRPYGTRRHTCPTSAAYREEAARIVTVLADRYGDLKPITAWQIDNEPGNHDSARCWCEECESAFTAWLQDRYGSIDALNAAWGTIFWSQVYPSFESVRLPRPAPTSHSPSLRLAQLRFASGQVVAGLEDQAAIIRRRSEGRDITVNFYAGDTFVDYRAVARIGGIGAIDSYPHGAESSDEVRFWHDLARGISGTNRGWIMEQQPGAINWTPLNPPVPDGQVAEWLEDAAVDGVERAYLFRWRAALAGQEQYHTGMLRHDGSRDRAFDEVAATAAALQAITPSPAEMAVIYDYEDAWAFDIEPHRESLTHRQMVVAAHAAARSLGTVDVVGWEDDLSRYRIVLVPAAVLASPEKGTYLNDAAVSGTTVVVGPRSFTRNLESVAEPHPVPLYVAAGAAIEGLSLATPAAIQDGPADAGIWIDLLDGDTPIGRFVSPQHLAGSPVATQTKRGSGSVVLMAASSTAAWRWLLERL